MTLPDYILAHLAKPFVWGKNDCVLFAAGWVKLATGRDHIAGPEKWATLLQAERILRKLGGLKAIVDARLQAINPNFAVDGDLALHQDALRLFSGPHIVGPGATGLVFFSRTEAVCAWRCS
jgi:hypothetical protein